MLRGGIMGTSRRNFLTQGSLGFFGAAAVGRDFLTHGAAGEEFWQQEPPPGAPPAFGTGPAVGPSVTPADFSAAEKLMQFELTDAQRKLAADSWRANLAAVYEQRTGPRKVALGANVAPWSRYSAVLPGQKVGPGREQNPRHLFSLA
jgi:hypothetical protein